MLEFQNTKTPFLKDTPQIGQKKFLSLEKLKIQFRGHMWLLAWIASLLLEVSMKRNAKN